MYGPWVIPTVQGQGHTLTEHWDGFQWSVVTSPNPSPEEDYLYSVSAVSPNDVWAVGYYTTKVGGLGYNQTFVEHWNGSQISKAPSPNFGLSFNDLYDIAGISRTDVWAVGYYCCDGSPSRTLIIHWNGSQWTLVSSPSPGQYNNYFQGVAAISTSDVWAAGYMQ